MRVVASHSDTGACDLTPGKATINFFSQMTVLSHLNNFKGSKVNHCSKEDYMEEKKIRSKVFTIKVWFYLPWNRTLSPHLAIFQQEDSLLVFTLNLFILEWQSWLPSIWLENVAKASPINISLVLAYFWYPAVFWYYIISISNICSYLTNGFF